MTDDHSAARDEVIALRDALVKTLGWYAPYPGTGVLTASDVERRLHAAGYEITRRDPAAGRVCVSVDAVRVARGWGMKQPSFKWSDYDQKAMDEIDQVITEATTG